MYQDIFSLENKVAIITGGAGGLGKDIAVGLAEFGADVVIADRERLRLEKLKNNANIFGKEVLALEADVTSYKSVEDIVRKTMSEYNRIDILINAAGINIRKPVLELDESEWDNIVNINLKGTYLCCKLIGEVMVSQNYGKIVNFGSVSSVLGHPEHSAYAASKGGVLLFTKVLAMEWAGNNINVNALGPAYINTALTSEYLAKDDNYEKIVKSIPLGRLGSPKDIVGAVIYLSSSASDFVTGTLLMVDGGRTAD